MPSLPVPMEAKLVSELPSPPGWQYEPKWDGFRAIVGRDGDEADIRSKSGKSLARFFPTGRFRHGTRFLRWRPDKAPRQCSCDQVQTELRPAGLAQLL